MRGGGCVAKKLRRVARKHTTGLPSVKYKSTLLRNGKLTEVHSSTRRLTHNCTRGVYQKLKRRYKQSKR